MIRTGMLLFTLVLTPMVSGIQASQEGQPAINRVVLEACANIARHEITKAVRGLDQPYNQQARRHMVATKARLLRNDSVVLMLRCVMMRQARR